MFDYIRGKITEKSFDYIVLDVSGIGFKIYCSKKCSEKMIIDDSYKVPTFLNVREDDISIFGFLDYKERMMFESLIKIPKIGPKAAISILSSLSPEEIYSAIIGNNISLLSSAQGVGKKTAEKLIVELRDKLGFMGNVDTETITVKNNDKLEEAFYALSGLGLTELEINKLLVNIDTANLCVEEIIRQALKSR